MNSFDIVYHSKKELSSNRSNGIFFQPKLTINQPNDIYEQEADAMADKVMRMPEKKNESAFFKPANISFLQRKCTHCEEEEKVQTKGESGGMNAPPVVHDVINSGGQPLDTATRGFMESRFGYDFGNVQIHNDSLAHQSSSEINALAYTHRNHVVFGADQYHPDTDPGKKLLAHELTHVVQQNNNIQPYRKTEKQDKTKNKKYSFNFGRLDTDELIEDSFDSKTDKETKPWVELVTVEFTSTETDADGNNHWVGNASVKYYDNPVKFDDFSFSVSGGSAELGKTDKGNFIVHRIEGIGYNSGSFSGTPGVGYETSNREGPKKRYSKDLIANMSYAVFYNVGEALHAGTLDISSHGCVHVNVLTNIKQLNYHSVIGLTKVKVTYP